MNRIIDATVDPKTGIVKRLSYLYRESADPLIYIIMSNITAFERYTSNKADFAATGSAVDFRRGCHSSVGEAVERYNAAASDFHDFLFGSYAELSSAGHTLLKPRDFTYFSEAQYGEKGFPFARPAPNLKISWLRGRDILSGESLYLPAGLVFNQYRQPGEPSICPDMHPGVASGSSYAHAICGALLEVIERDSLMLAWMLHKPLKGISGEDGAPMRPLEWGIPAELTLSLLQVPNQFGVPCVYALLCDEKRRIAGAGCSAAFTAQEAAAKAACEAVQTYYFNRELPKGKEGRLRSISHRIPSSLLDERERKKLRLTEVLFNLGFYQDELRYSLLGGLLHPDESIQIESILDFPVESRNSHGLLEKFSQAGLHPIGVELTAPDVFELGWVVYRVIIPGLVPNFPAYFPPLGLARLYGQAGENAPLNTAPVPYS